METTLTPEEQADVLSDLDEERMKAEIQKAEQEADITIVMPQMGIEYQLEPTEEQRSSTHKMVSLGADIVFGGHPHVVEPAEVVNKDGQNKLIIYQWGISFLISVWKPWGCGDCPMDRARVLMDVTIEKVGRKTRIKTATAHPTWVSRTLKGTYSPEGYELYKYQTYILEDFIQGGKYRDKLDEGDQGESGHGLPRNEGTCSLGLASE